MSDRHYLAELIRDCLALERAVEFVLYRIARAGLDPYRFEWTCEPFFGEGYRLLAVELRG